MNFYDWMLALHLLAAFAIASALVLYSVLVFNGRRTESPDQTKSLFRIAPIGTPLIGGGSVLALILGVILAIDSDGFEIWNGWIIAAIVLWAVMGAIGQRTGAYYTPSRSSPRKAARALSRRWSPGYAPHRRPAPPRNRARVRAHTPRHDLQAGSLTVLPLSDPQHRPGAVLHVAGAMILMGGLVTAAGAGIVGWRDTGGGLRRLSALTLFAVALPGWIIMRVAAEWVYSKEHLDKLKDDPTWITIGFITSEGGGIILLVALILGGIGVRRARSGGGGGPAQGEHGPRRRSHRRLRRHGLGDGRQAQLVVALLRGLEPVAHDRLDRIGRPRDQSLDVGLGLERREHVVGHRPAVATAGAPHADAQPQEVLRAERLGDRAEPVVAGEPAAEPRLEPPLLAGRRRRGRPAPSPPAP